MDTRQLETFLAIIQRGGFAAAAKEVNLSASAVSQQISALEQDLGTALFDRSRRPPALTTKGREVQSSAQSILRIVAETKATVRDGDVGGTLALGALRTFGAYILPHALARLKVSYPDLSYRLRVGLSEDLMADVVSGQLDAALVADHVAVPAGLQWTLVFSEPLVVLTPPGVTEKRLEKLVRDVPFIRYGIQVPLARQIDTEIARLGLTVRQVVSVNTMSAVLGCVQAGLGFAIVPYAALRGSQTTSLDWFPFGATPIHRGLGIVQRPNSRRGKVLEQLSEVLRQTGISQGDDG
ncbi:LysR family transcriptional regulator [Parasedimentitalea maritima]|uniref:LysR family transcriptional regulator n=1 Tax=Parasedimentitalea maritima TaxID=2578117 RepID=A0ABY2USV4_9RHOB|nr:LysR family transcriptional regulator [Zongyanglinia marina]TLP60309.1 LysR family transcriptional regulator [Zongyanglinia marina]